MPLDDYFMLGVGVVLLGVWEGGRYAVARWRDRRAARRTLAQMDAARAANGEG
jgi:hypothetical protein